MKLRTTLVCAVVSLFPLVSLAEPRHEEARGGGEHHEAVRGPAPRFVAHPAGVHPRGAQFHSHPVRVLAPRVVARGAHVWGHWGHPEFARPTYYWDWASIRQVTCIAEDSYGDQYPVTENGYPGFGLGNMTGVEDDALDRCYQESGQDPSCYLATCSHY